MAKTELDIKNVNDLVEKFDQLKKQNPLDLSSDQDLCFAIMNLISTEEHFVFTGAKTGKNKYYDLVEQVREIRKELLKEIVKNPEGELWCISKHLLATVMRLMEVGSKQLSLNNKTKAYDFFKKAYDLYSLFWGLNMGIIDIGKAKQISEDTANKNDQTKEGLLGTLGQLVQKAIDCCIE